MALLLLGIGVALGLAWWHWRQIPVLYSGERGEVLERLRHLLKS